MTITPLNNIPVRFFTVQDIDLNPDGEPQYELDLVEVTEEDFLEHEGVIEYERHTVHLNGCSQICLTKSRYGG